MFATTYRVANVPLRSALEAHNKAAQIFMLKIGEVQATPIVLIIALQRFDQRGVDGSPRRNATVAF
jgi:hypothetical protein